MAKNMENENAVNNVTENQATETVSKETKGQVMEMLGNGEKTGLLVERERFDSKKDSKEYWGYFLRGILRGKEIKVHLAPPDFGGYGVLDLVFGEDLTAELFLLPYSLKDEDTGKVINGFTYEVRNIDKIDGMVYSGQIKPARKSDKSLLDMLLSRMVNKK